MSEEENKQKKLELSFEESRRGKRLEAEQETKAIGRRLASYVGRRLVDRPNIGGRRRGRSNIDLPTGGIPGTRKPTGSDFDPDRDGWTDEGTTNPRWIGVSSAGNVSKPGKRPKLQRIEKRQRRLSSAQESTELNLSDAGNDQYASELEEARDEYRRLRDAVAELERSGDWIGGDKNVVIAGTESDSEIAKFGINNINTKPKNQTRKELESQVRERLNSQGITDEQQIDREVQNEINKRISLARKKLDRAEQMVKIRSYGLEAKRIRESQNVIDVEEIPEEKIAILAEESDKIKTLGTISRYVLFRSEHTDGDYFVHHGASELDGDVLDPSKSSGSTPENRGSASVLGDTRFVNDMSSAALTRDLVENRTRERGLRSVLKKIQSSPENSKIESDEEINAISELIDSPYAPIVKKGKSRGWRIGDELNGDSLAKAYGRRGLNVGELINLVERNIEQRKKRADSAAGTVAILEQNNGQFMSVFAGAHKAVLDSGWKGYLGRRKTSDFLATQEKLDEVMNRAFVEMFSRGTSWVGYGRWGLELSDRVGPSDEWQVLGKVKPLFGISTKMTGLGDYRLTQKYQRVIPALVAHAIKMHKQKGYVDTKELIDNVGKTRLSSGKVPGETKPKYPMRPSFGPIIGGAQDEFSGISTWKEFLDKLKTRPLIFLDYESTGVVDDEWGKWLGNGNPTQIGAVKVVDGKIVDRFNLYMNPNEPLGDWSLRNLKDADGNPITNEWLSSQMSIADAHRRFAEFAGEDAIIVAQNARFDKEVLERSLIESGIDWMPKGYLDTMVISQMTLPKWNETTDDGPYKINSEGKKQPSSSLAAITKYLGVDLVKHHSAEADAETASRVLDAIIEKAIEKDWPNDIFDPEIRRKRMESEEDRFVRDIQAFEDAKSDWLNKQKEKTSEKLSSGEDEEDYRGLHAAPGRDFGAPLHNLLSIYPEDVYSSDAIRLYGAGEPDKDNDAFSLIRRFRNKPDARITIYRAVPLNIQQQIDELLRQQKQILRRGRVPRKANTSMTASEYFDRITDEIKILRSKLDGDKKIHINKGDWVTPFEKYAREHGRAALNGKFRIIKKTVKASELFTSGDSWLEWGYDPEPSRKLQSGGVNRPIIRLTNPYDEQKENETTRAHAAKNYKYGDESFLGGQIRRTKTDWLKGLGSEQIANLVIPSSMDEYFEQYLDDYAPTWRDVDDGGGFVKQMREIFNKYFADNPWAAPDFSPETIAALRKMVKDALDSNPKLMWAFRTHGAPIFYVQTREAASLYEQVPVIKAKLESINQQRRKINPNFQGAFIRGSSNPFLNSVWFNPRHAIDRESYVDGGKVEIFSDETSTIGASDLVIDKSLTGVLTHEWGHWLHFRAARDYELAGKQKNRTYYGSGDPQDDNYLRALTVAEEYKDRTPTVDSMKEWEDGIDINEIKDRPRTITSYGNVNKPESMAEAIVAIFHPNETIKDFAINEKLRRDAYAILQIEEGSEPWAKTDKTKRLGSGTDTKLKPKVQYKKTQIAKRAKDYVIRYSEDEKRRELAKKTLKKGFAGGFTVELDTMDDVKKGVAIARNRRGMTFSAAADFDIDGNPSDELIDDFLAWIELNGPEQFENPSDGATKVAIGGWVSKGELYLDVTDIYPTDKYLDRAAQIGLKQRQIAVTHLEKLWELIDSGSEDLSAAFIDSGGDGGEIISRETVRQFANFANVFSSRAGGLPPFPTRIMREQRRARRRLSSGEVVDKESIDAAKSIIYETLDGMPKERMTDLAKERNNSQFPDPEVNNSKDNLTENEIKIINGIVSAGRQLHKAILAEKRTEIKNRVPEAMEPRRGRNEGLGKDQIDKADEIKIARAIIAQDDIDATTSEHSRALSEQHYSDSRTLGEAASHAARTGVFGFEFEDNKKASNGLTFPIVVGKNRFMDSLKLILAEDGNGQRTTPYAELVRNAQRETAVSSHIVREAFTVRSPYTTKEKLKHGDTEVVDWTPGEGIVYTDTPMSREETNLVEKEKDATNDTIQIMTDAKEALHVLIAEIGRGVGPIGQSRLKKGDTTEVLPENITDEEILELLTRTMPLKERGFSTQIRAGAHITFNPYKGTADIALVEDEPSPKHEPGTRYVRTYNIDENGKITPTSRSTIDEKDMDALNLAKSYTEEFMFAGIQARKKLLIDLVRRGIEDESAKRVIRESNTHVVKGDIVGSNFYIPQGTPLKQISILVNILKEKQEAAISDLRKGDSGKTLPKVMAWVNENKLKRPPLLNVPSDEPKDRATEKEITEFLQYESSRINREAVVRVLKAAGIEFARPEDIKHDVMIARTEEGKDRETREIATRANAVLNGVVQPIPNDTFYELPEDVKKRTELKISEVLSLLPKTLVDGSMSGELQDEFSPEPLKVHLVHLFDVGDRRAHASSWQWSDGPTKNPKHATIISFEIPRGTENSPIESRRSPTSWSSIYLHEVTHAVENANDWIKYAQWLHWESRRNGESLRRLNEIGGIQYRDEEVGVRDEWKNIYAGKYYGNQPEDAKRKPWQENYEILTTGMQSLFFGDEKADDDHIAFTLGILLASISRRQYRQDVDGVRLNEDNTSSPLSSGGDRRPSDEAQIPKTLSSGRRDSQDAKRREMGRLLAQKDGSLLSRSMISIANDYANYRYNMSDEMAEALLRTLRNLPDYDPDSIGKWFSSGATYESLVDLQKNSISKEQVNAVDEAEEILGGKEFSKKDEKIVTKEPIFEYEIIEIKDSPEREKAKEQLKDAVSRAFSGEIELEKDIIVTAKNGEAINLGKTIIVSTETHGVSVDSPSKEDIDDMEKEVGSSKMLQGDSPFTKIEFTMKIRTADKDAEKRLIDAGIPQHEDFILGTLDDFEKIGDDGFSLGRAYRTLMVRGNDTFVVHDSITIGKSARGFGIGSALNARNENIYTMFGANAIYTMGQSSGSADRTGATHWARNGFTWAGEPSKQRFIKIIDDAINSSPELFSDEERRKISSLYRKDPTTGEFISSATPEELIDFKEADSLFRGVGDAGDGGGPSIYFKRELPARTQSRISSVFKRGRKRDKSRVLSSGKTKKTPKSKKSQTKVPTGEEIIDRFKEKRIPDYVIEGMLDEARKYRTPKEFALAFSLRFMHGFYGHLTSEEGFKVDTNKKTWAGTSFSTEPGMFISSTPQAWKQIFRSEIQQLEHLTPREKNEILKNKGTFVAFITLSGAPAGSYVHTTGLDGHQIFVGRNALPHAKVHAVLPYSRGLRLFNKIKNDMWDVLTDGDVVRGDYSSKLEEIWKTANKSNLADVPNNVLASGSIRDEDKYDRRLFSGENEKDAKIANLKDVVEKDVESSDRGGLRKSSLKTVSFELKNTKYKAVIFSEMYDTKAKALNPRTVDVTIYNEDDKMIGELVALQESRAEDPDNIRIDWVHVFDGYKRRGLATAMLRLANKYNIANEPVKHSRVLTKAGEKFAKATPLDRLSLASGSVEPELQNVIDAFRNGEAPPERFEIPDSWFRDDQSRENFRRNFPNGHMKWEPRYNFYVPATGTLEPNSGGYEEFRDKNLAGLYLNRNHWFPAYVNPSSPLASVMRLWRGGFSESRAMAKVISGQKVTEAYENDKGFKLAVSTLRQGLADAVPLSRPSYRVGYIYKEMGGDGSVGSVLDFSAAAVTFNPKTAMLFDDDALLGPTAGTKYAKMLFEFPEDARGLMFDEMGERNLGRRGAKGGELYPQEGIVTGKFRIARIEKRELDDPYKDGKKIKRDVYVLERIGDSKSIKPSSRKLSSGYFQLDEERKQEIKRQVFDNFEQGSSYLLEDFEEMSDAEFAYVMSFTGELQRADSSWPGGQSPERIMFGIYDNFGSIAAPTAEHAGDLYWRSNHNRYWESGGYELNPIIDKIEKVLSFLTNPYGFEKELREQLQGNGKDWDAFAATMKNYGEAHEKLPVYNHINELMVRATVALGEMRWDDAVRELENLLRLSKDRNNWEKELSRESAIEYLTKKRNLMIRVMDKISEGDTLEEAQRKFARLGYNKNEVAAAYRERSSRGSADAESNRLSSGRTTYQKLEDGPLNLTFGRDSHGIPVIAETEVLAGRYGKSEGSIKRYFKKKYGVKVSVSKKALGRRAEPAYREAAYGALQGLEDVLINLPGFKEMLRDNNFTIDLTHSSVLDEGTGVLGTFGPRSKLFKVSQFNEGEKHYTQLKVNLSEVKRGAESLVRKTFTWDFRGMKVSVDGTSGESFIPAGASTTNNILGIVGLPSFDESFLLRPDQPLNIPPWKTRMDETKWNEEKIWKLDSETAKRMAYSTIIHELGHLIDFSMRKRENQVVKIPSMMKQLAIWKFLIEMQGEEDPNSDSETRAIRATRKIIGGNPDDVYESATRVDEIEAQPGVTKYGATKAVENVAESFASWFLFSRAPSIRTIPGRKRTERLDGRDFEVIDAAPVRPRPKEIANIILQPLFDKLGPRLSSGRTVLSSAQTGPNRSIDEIVKNGPIRLSFGRDSSGMPIVAKRQTLIKRFGDTSQKIRDYFASTHGAHVFVGESELRNKTVDVTYGTLQALDDLFSSINIEKNKGPLIIINSKSNKNVLGSFVSPYHFPQEKEQKLIDDAVNSIQKTNKSWEHDGGTIFINPKTLMIGIEDRLGFYGKLQGSDLRAEDVVEPGSGDTAMPGGVEDLFYRLSWDYDKTTKPVDGEKQIENPKNITDKERKLFNKYMRQFRSQAKRRYGYAVAVHEFAHALDSSAWDRKASSFHTEPWFFSGTLSDVELPNATTVYGATSSVENFAEAFSTWFLFAGSAINIDGSSYGERAEKFMKLFLEYAQDKNKNPYARHSVKGDQQNNQPQEMTISDNDIENEHPVSVFAMAPIIEKIQNGSILRGLDELVLLYSVIPALKEQIDEINKKYKKKEREKTT